MLVLVAALDVLDPVAEVEEVCVVVWLSSAVLLVLAVLLELCVPAVEVSAAPTAPATWPPSPTTVIPPPVSAESTARRAQRRGVPIGLLL